MRSLGPFYIALHPIFKILRSPFAIDCEEVALKLPVFKKILNTSFLFVTSSISIRNPFCLLEDSPNLSPTVSRFSPRYHCEQLFSKMNNAESMQRSQPIKLFTCPIWFFSQPLHITLIWHLYMIANNITWLIHKLWLLPHELTRDFCCFLWFFVFCLLFLFVWLFFFFFFFFGGVCSFKIVAPGPPVLNFVSIELKNLRTPDKEFRMFFWFHGGVLRKHL